MNNINKHHNHKLEIIEGPFSYGSLQHDGRLMCKTCNIQLKWINQFQINLFKEHYKPNMTYDEYNTTVDSYMHSVSEHDPAIIFLAVPYKDKDTVKKLGASWDPYHKLWYTTVRRQYAEKLTPWMMQDDILKLKKVLRTI